MKLPRDASGENLARALERAFGYRRIHQQGSHLILETDRRRRHRLAISAHKSLRVGTLNAILRAVTGAQDMRKEDVAQMLFG